jgi:hypothetical protein
MLCHHSLFVTGKRQAQLPVAAMGSHSAGGWLAAAYLNTLM